MFYLGTHQPNWLASAGVPLFVSDRRLRRYRRLPRAAAPWALDSGGFTELSRYGTWDTGPTPAEYVARVRRYRDEIGHLDWAAQQDWMCERFIVAKTGLSVREHVHRTVGNFCDLCELATDLDFAPSVQGDRPSDYQYCIERYDKAGVDLRRARLVGVGSVCRRQSTREVGEILTLLHQAGITRLHGFGFKIQGLARYGALLSSADSMAWSAHARRRPPLLGCTRHASCANCPRYALQWRQRVLDAAAKSVAQPALFGLSGWAA